MSRERWIDTLTKAMDQVIAVMEKMGENRIYAHDWDNLFIAKERIYEVLQNLKNLKNRSKS